MIETAARLWTWSDGKGGRWHFLTIPEGPSAEIRLESAAFGPRRGFGAVRVLARIGAVEWRTSVFPQKEGTYILPVKAAVRKRAGISADDEVAVSLLLG